MAENEAGKKLEPIYKESYIYISSRNVSLIKKQESSTLHQKKGLKKKRGKKGNGKYLKQVFVMFICFI